MGYSVPEHFQALTRLGPTIHHRRSFAPVAVAYGDLPLATPEDAGLPFEPRPAALPIETETPASEELPRCGAV
jgi:ribonuclease HII